MSTPRLAGQLTLLVSAQCDNCLIGTMFFFSYLSCICSLVACITQIEGLEEAADVISEISQIIWCSVRARGTRHLLLDLSTLYPPLTRVWFSQARIQTVNKGRAAVLNTYTRSIRQEVGRIRTWSQCGLRIQQQELTSALDTAAGVRVHADAAQGAAGRARQEPGHGQACAKPLCGVQSLGLTLTLTLTLSLMLTLTQNLTQL